MSGIGKCCHPGSCIFLNAWNPFRRHSSSHSVSSLLAEIKRMVSSFRPAGAISISISVVKPNSYSLLAISSIISLLFFIRQYLSFHLSHGTSKFMLRFHSSIFIFFYQLSQKWVQRKQYLCLPVSETAKLSSEIVSIRQSFPRSYRSWWHWDY